MSPEPVERGRIREYLLRNLAEAERARFEESYFADDALLDRVEAEEDLLVSDYVLGRLTDSDRHRFEQALLATPYYRDRVETTTRLRRRIARDEHVRTLSRGPAQAPASGIFPGRTGIVIAFSLLAVLLLASLVTALRLKEQLTALRAQLNAPAPAPITAASGGVVPSTPTVVLQAPAEEGVVVRRIQRAPGSPLLLVVPRSSAPADARSWRVALRDGTGAIVWDSGDQPAPAGAADLAVRLPAGVPEPGRFGMTLSSGGDPAFSVLLDIVPSPGPPPR